MPESRAQVRAARAVLSGKSSLPERKGKPAGTRAGKPNPSTRLRVKKMHAPRARIGLAAASGILMSLIGRLLIAALNRLHAYIVVRQITGSRRLALFAALS